MVQVFLKAAGATSIMGQLAFIFDESPAQLVAAAAKSAAAKSASSGSVSVTEAPPTRNADAALGAAPAAGQPPVSDAAPAADVRAPHATEAAVPADSFAPSNGASDDNSSAAQEGRPDDSSGADVEVPSKDLPQQQGPAKPSIELLAAAQEAADEARPSVCPALLPCNVIVRIGDSDLWWAPSEPAKLEPASASGVHVGTRHMPSFQVCSRAWSNEDLFRSLMIVYEVQTSSETSNQLIPQSDKMSRRYASHGGKPRSVLGCSYLIGSQTR